MPSFNHSIVQLNLGFELKTRYREQFQFASGINLDVMGRTPGPDLGIFAKTAADMANDTTTAPRLPLTTIEILSPTRALSELTAKAKTYFQAGVKSCWIVLPEVRGIFVYSSPGKYTFSTMRKS